MLSPELVRARRRGDSLQLSKLSSADHADALLMAEGLLLGARDSLFESAEQLEENLALVPREARQEKLFLGLKKLVLDRCEFTMPLTVDVVALRKELFELACERRLQMSEGRSFERSEILSEIGAKYGLSSQEVDEGMFGDLKGAQRLTRAPEEPAEELVSHYETAQIQGVLLRASKLTCHVVCDNPDDYRDLFHKLKFRQLLYRLEALDSGYKIEIEGPFSLFESVTKYGLQLALLVPALQRCTSARLLAELKWGKERRPLHFETTLQRQVTNQDQPSRVRSEVQALLSALEAHADFQVESSTELLEIPGVGLCVPDLVFRAKGRPPVYVEVLGFWSRDAVWKRVEWATAQQEATSRAKTARKRVIFAISSRLRVSSEVLPEETLGALYVYKGTMNAKTLLKHVSDLAART